MSTRGARLLTLVAGFTVTTLVAATMPFADPDKAVGVLGVLEIVIGAGLLSRRAHRIFLVAVVVHLAGTFLTVVMASSLLWRRGRSLPAPRSRSCSRV